MAQVKQISETHLAQRPKTPTVKSPAAAFPAEKRGPESCVSHTVGGSLKATPATNGPRKSGRTAHQAWRRNVTCCRTVRPTTDARSGATTPNKDGGKEKGQNGVAGKAPPHQLQKPTPKLIIE